MDPMLYMPYIGGAAALATMLLFALLRKRKPQNHQTPSRPPLPRHQEPSNQRETRRTAPKKLSGDMVKQVVDSVPLIVSRVEIGRQKTGERAIGQRLADVPYPADEIDIRPMRGMDEFPNLLSSEQTAPPVIRFARMISNEALVMGDLELQTITEPVYRPLYREAHRIMYILLDLSGSMFGKNGEYDPNWWMIPIWKGIVQALLNRCIQEDILFIMRGFSDRVTDKIIARSQNDASRVRTELNDFGPMGGTNIELALESAMSDFEQERYDFGSIVIVTDGQDDRFDAACTRRQLQQARLGLHAILLGTQNQTLQAASNAYQIIPEEGIVEPLVQNH